MSLFFMMILLMLGVSVWVFYKAVQKTKSDLEKHFGGTYPMIPFDNARKLTEYLRSRNVFCTRCSKQATAILGSGNKYRCDTCHAVFPGPPHIPTGVG